MVSLSGQAKLKPENMPVMIDENHEFHISNEIQPEQSTRLLNLLYYNADIFAQNPRDLGRTSVIKHQVTDGTQPIKQRPYRAASAAQ